MPELLADIGNVNVEQVREAPVILVEEMLVEFFTRHNPAAMLREIFDERNLPRRQRYGLGLRYQNKDLAPAGENANEDGWADVGHGTLDWNQLARDAKARTRARYYVMEHDKPSDAIRFARRSIAAAGQWK